MAQKLNIMTASTTKLEIKKKGGVYNQKCRNCEKVHLGFYDMII